VCWRTKVLGCQNHQFWYNYSIKSTKGQKMTVSELIAALSKMPADATVLVDDSDYGYCVPAVILDSDGEVVIGLA
jgi:hypothetical protein